MLAFQRAGTLQYAEPQIREEMRLFVRQYPREPIVRLWRQDQRRTAVVHVPERRENLAAIVASPREHKPTRRRRTTSRDGPDDSDPEPPPLVVHLRGFLAASVRMVQHCERRRAKTAAT
jgi:hypothetical protein